MPLFPLEVFLDGQGLLCSGVFQCDGQGSWQLVNLDIASLQRLPSARKKTTSASSISLCAGSNSITSTVSGSPSDL